MTKPPSWLSSVLSRLRSKRTDKERLALRPFQAVSIYHGIEACGLAKHLSEHRFLARDAPALPLAGCTMRERCDCRYLKHKDRRSSARRHFDAGSHSTDERRRFKGRRAEDIE